MKFTTVAALLATFAAVASAALPVEPAINGFIIQDDTPSARQQIVIDSDHHKPAQSTLFLSPFLFHKDPVLLSPLNLLAPYTTNTLYPHINPLPSTLLINQS
jgi:hypothetical protein